MLDPPSANLSTLIALSVVAAACSPQPETKAPKIELSKAVLEDGRKAFDIALPSGCEINTEGVKLDFQTFRVSCGGVPYAGLYVGNFADKSVPRSRLLATPYSWPSEVQVWSLEVPKDQAGADRIAASVRVRINN